MKAKIDSTNSDMKDSMAALKRAARSARKLAEATGTPFYVMKNGRVVNLNPGGRRRRPKKSRTF